MKWPPATTFSQALLLQPKARCMTPCSSREDWEEEDECFLRTLQPLAEREESNVSAAFRVRCFGFVAGRCQLVAVLQGLAVGTRRDRRQGQLSQSVEVCLNSWQELEETVLPGFNCDSGH